MPLAALAFRLLLAIACLLGLGACAHLSSSSTRAWAGDYAFGQGRLQLRASGEFDYQGGHCFLHDSDSDVGMADAFAGRFRVERGWIVLEPQSGFYIKGCSGIGLRLYALRMDGHRYLLDEGWLRAVVNEVRDGTVLTSFAPWHRAGEPAAFTAPLADWLPSPYAQWLRQPPPAGRVIAVGPVSTRTRYGSAGRVEGQESGAVLSLDFGRRQGAFEGMRVCVEGRRSGLALDTVDEGQSTLRWTGPATAAPPAVGTRVGGACP